MKYDLSLMKFQINGSSKGYIGPKSVMFKIGSNGDILKTSNEELQWDF